MAQKLLDYKSDPDVIVFGIARGGVVVAKAIAEALQVPLDAIVVKKIGSPFQEELAIGAVGPGGVVYWDQRLIQKLRIDKNIKNQQFEVKKLERQQKEKLLRGNKRYTSLEGKVVLLVDDGVATGATAMVAVKFLQKKKAKKIVLVTPVIARETLLKLKRYFRDVVYLEVPRDFLAVGQFYENFPQVSDEEVISILKDNR